MNRDVPRCSGRGWACAYRILRVVIIIAPFVLLAWIADEYYIVSGHRRISVSPGAQTKEVERFSTPGARRVVKKDSAGERYYALATNDVALDVSLPRPFLRVDVGVRFAADQEQDVDLAIRNLETSTLRTVPFVRADPTIDRILDGSEGNSWFPRRSGNLLLLQRTKRYTTLPAFLEDPPALDRIRLVDVDPLWYATVPPPTERTDVRIPFEGPHVFWLNAAPGTLRLSVEYMDRNEHEGEDHVQLILTDRVGTVIASAENADDADDRADGIRSINVLTAEAPVTSGFYRLEYAASRDIVTRRMVAETADVFVENRVVLDGRAADNTDQLPDALRWFTNGARVRFSAHSENGLQQVHVGGADVQVRSVEKVYEKGLGAGGGAIALSTPDIVLRTNGLFSWKSIPVDARVALTTADDELPTLDGVGYILALYPERQRSGDMVTASQVFEGDDALDLLGAHFRVQLRFPGLRQRDGLVRLYDVPVKVWKPPLDAGRVLDRFRSVLVPNREQS
ncbi:MAG: hypothetical protein HY341_02170 [Candidatus Kerfeldbacteria bacterium]|nr:hypothetical protein [Candidatus Kerfeldbacteria bacterium]